MKTRRKALDGNLIQPLQFSRRDGYQGLMSVKSILSYVQRESLYLTSCPTLTKLPNLFTLNFRIHKEGPTS